MDIDMDVSLTCKTDAKNNNVSRIVDMNQQAADLSSYISNKESTFHLDSNLKMKQVMDLLEETDNLESSILNEFQVKLCRLKETRKKLRNHAQGLIEEIAKSK